MVQTSQRSGKNSPTHLDAKKSLENWLKKSSCLIRGCQLPSDWWIPRLIFFFFLKKIRSIARKNPRNVGFFGHQKFNALICLKFGPHDKLSEIFKGIRELGFAISWYFDFCSPSNIGSPREKKSRRFWNKHFRCKKKFTEISKQARPRFLAFSQISGNFQNRKINLSWSLIARILFDNWASWQAQWACHEVQFSRKSEH